MKKKLLSILTALLCVFTINPVLAQDGEVEELPYGLPLDQVYSVFTTAVQGKDYDLALFYAKPMIKLYPKKSDEYENYNAENVYKKLIDIYADLSSKENDPTVKSALLDTSLQYYDVVFETFDDTEIDKFNWILNRGRFYQEHADFITGGLSKAYADYNTLIEMDVKKMTELGKGYYIQITLQNLVSQGEKEEALALIEKVNPHADENTLKFIEKVQEQLFSDPEERRGFLEDKLAETPNDAALLNELYDVYINLDDLDAARETAAKLYEVEKTLENVMNMASIVKKNGDNRGSIDYFNEALELAETDDEKAEIYYALSDSYLLIENFKSARSNARKALKARPNWGEPYIKIAAVYAQQVSSCASSNMEREDKAVYWLVLDYLDKAKSVDPNVTSTVNNLYKSYTPVVPNAEEKFFKGWTKGNKLKIDKSIRDCYSWINETTTVR